MRTRAHLDDSNLAHQHLSFGLLIYTGNVILHRTSAYIYIPLQVRTAPCLERTRAWCSTRHPGRRRARASVSTRMFSCVDRPAFSRFLLKGITSLILHSAELYNLACEFLTRHFVLHLVYSRSTTLMINSVVGAKGSGGEVVAVREGGERREKKSGQRGGGWYIILSHHRQKRQHQPEIRVGALETAPC